MHRESCDLCSLSDNKHKYLSFSRRLTKLSKFKFNQVEIKLFMNAEKKTD